MDNQLVYDTYVEDAESNGLTPTAVGKSLFSSIASAFKENSLTNDKAMIYKALDMLTYLAIKTIMKFETKEFNNKIKIYMTDFKRFQESKIDIAEFLPNTHKFLVASMISAFLYTAVGEILIRIIKRSSILSTRAISSAFLFLMKIVLKVTKKIFGNMSISRGNTLKLISRYIQVLSAIRFKQETLRRSNSKEFDAEEYKQAAYKQGLLSFKDVILKDLETKKIKDLVDEIETKWDIIKKVINESKELNAYLNLKIFGFILTVITNLYIQFYFVKSFPIGYPGVLGKFVSTTLNKILRTYFIKDMSDIANIKYVLDSAFDSKIIIGTFLSDTATYLVMKYTHKSIFAVITEIAGKLSIFFLEMISILFLLSRLAFENNPAERPLPPFMRPRPRPGQ